MHSWLHSTSRELDLPYSLRFVRQLSPRDQPFPQPQMSGRMSNVMRTSPVETVFTREVTVCAPSGTARMAAAKTPNAYLICRSAPPGSRAHVDRGSAPAKRLLSCAPLYRDQIARCS